MASEALGFILTALFHIATAASPISFGGFDFSGDFTTLDLLAAATNALNGALLARRPDHYKNFTIVGILLMALVGGIGGGIARDVLLGQVPGALTNPAYVTVCIVAGLIGYQLAFAEGQLFREGLFQFATSFSLVLYAIVGAQKGVEAGLPVLGAMVLAIVGPTAGRWMIDVSSGVVPKQFIRGEWFIVTAVLTGAIWIGCDAIGFNTWVSAAVSFAIAFTFRMAALYGAWEEPLATEPTGVYRHDDGRPMLGRKLKGKSEREMHDLGLSVEKS